MQTSQYCPKRVSEKIPPYSYASGMQSSSARNLQHYQERECASFHFGSQTQASSDPVGLVCAPHSQTVADVPGLGKGSSKLDAAGSRRIKKTTILPSTSRFKSHLARTAPALLGQPTMADVRSLLRNERTSRRINHPQASYSSSGTLTCTVCRIPIKSESLWEGHLRSSGHVTRSRQNNGDGSSTTASESRKRKASEVDDEGDHSKRPKASKPASGLPQDFFDESAALEAPHLPGEPERQASTEMASHPKLPPPIVTPLPSNNLPSDFFDPSAAPVAVAPSKQAAADAVATDTVDEDEYAAFEREIAAPSLLTADATITAAPISAAELAARATAEANTQRKEQADADMEGEQEDAVRRMEVEIDEMEELEERVKRLRDRREELRRRAEARSGDSVGMEDAVGEDASRKSGTASRAAEEKDGDEDEDDEAEWDDWAFRPV